MMNDDPKPLTRKELAEFLPSQRAIRAFEKLFDLIPSELQNNQSDATGANTNAVLALALIEALSYAVEHVSTAPVMAQIEDESFEIDHVDSIAEDSIEPAFSFPRSIEFDQVTVFDQIIMGKETTAGIQIDPSAPAFGWHDLFGDIVIKVAGANDPTWAVYRDGLHEWEFSNVLMNEHEFKYHIPHDYVSGSDVYIHVHWSQNVVDTGGPAGVTGTMKFYFECSYAKGHGTPGGSADAFTASVTTSVTQQGSTTQYGQMIAETAATDDGTLLIDRDRLEPDGVIKIRAYRDPADAADTLDQTPFVHYIDIHYQSTNIATKNKAPNFYL